HLTIAAAFVLLAGFGAGQALAQDSNQPAEPTMASPTAPGDNTAAPAAAPQVTPPAPEILKAAAEPTSNPYGIGHIWETGNIVSRSVLVLLGVMSLGTWYIFFVKFFEQGRVLGQARSVERRFWTSGTLNEGIDKLPKNSMFRSIAESGVRASQGGTTLVGLNDWIAMSLTRQLDDANSKLQGGIAFLASVGSTAPFVGLFGTVWGILQALIAIGVAGQASIDKVAGPVGEALIMTAVGLAVAVPAVLLYNYLVRRNKVIQEKLRGFAGDLQTYLITKSK
ncbi:MAG: MotA/TolQ/ExbB proton channel family protein, partial [Pseudolabrys sp.]